MKKVTNVAASVRQRLLNVATQNRQDFGLVLTKYALERLLYRLSLSEYRDIFILKGALLFDLWTRTTYRPTRDLDLLGSGDDSTERYRNIFVELCAQQTPDDGLDFLAGEIHVERMRDEEEYEGVRVSFEARLANARIPVRIDVGFGDVVTPAPVEATYPTLLDMPAPRIRVYPKESVIAEKLEAIVKLGIANSRMKDFYDVWELSRQFSFDGQSLALSIEATFRRRRTDLPAGVPLALTSEFYNASAKRTQWNAFLRKSSLNADRSLQQVADDLGRFLLPILDSIRKSNTPPDIWPPDGPWQAIGG